MKNIEHSFLKIIFILISFCSFSQNKSYKIIYEEIYPLLNTDYQKAKEKWLEMELIHDRIEPVEVEIFLAYSLENNDIVFFKNRIISLMKNNGWHYIEKIDTTSSIIERSKLKRMIKVKKLNNWVSNKSFKFSNKRKINYELNSFFSERINQLIFCDQEITKLVPSENSTNINNKLVDSIIAKIDFFHIEEIVKLCILNDSILLNSFDNEIGINNKLGLILWHNLKTKTNFQKSWDALLPFIDKAYFQNKISYTFFKSYDKWSVYHYGNQYYGTIEGAVIRDNETYFERKIKYKL